MLSVLPAAPFLDFFFFLVLVVVVLSPDLVSWANRLTVPTRNDRPSVNVMSFFMCQISLDVRSYVDNFRSIISVVHEPALKALLKLLHLRAAVTRVQKSRLSCMLLNKSYFAAELPDAGGSGPFSVHTMVGMKKAQLARRLAKESGITTAAAADQLDELLTTILRRVRQGQSASLPGLGTFIPGAKPAFYFEECLPPGARPSKSRKEAK